MILITVRLQYTHGNTQLEVPAEIYRLNFKKANVVVCQFQIKMFWGYSYAMISNLGSLREGAQFHTLYTTN